jgi:hypothetical protein
VSKNNIKRNTNSVTFTLNNLTRSGYDYEPGDNEVSNVVVVNQTSQNLFPNAVNDSYATNQDVQLGGVNVMGNDTQGDPPTTVTAYENPSDQGGTVSITPQGALTYDPAGGFFGTDTFDYTLTDTNGDTDTATVTVQVNQIGGGGFEVTAVGYKVRGVHHANITWSGFGTAQVDISRGPTHLATVNDGNQPYTDNTGNKGGGATYVYTVCEQGSVINCASDSVSF